MYSTEEAVILGALVVDGYRQLIRDEPVSAGDIVYTLRAVPIQLAGGCIGTKYTVYRWVVKRPNQIDIDYRNGPVKVTVIVIEEPESGMTTTAHYSDLWVGLNDQDRS